MISELAFEMLVNQLQAAVVQRLECDWFKKYRITNGAYSEIEKQSELWECLFVIYTFHYSEKLIFFGINFQIYKEHLLAHCRLIILIDNESS
jgi:hypothetical protein